MYFIDNQPCILKNKQQTNKQQKKSGWLKKNKKTYIT